MNFKNMFLALALVFATAARAADAPAPVAAACDSCVISNALGSVKNFILDNKKTILVAAVVLGAIAYYVATADDADTDSDDI